jgi:hypothetical protein
MDVMFWREGMGHMTPEEAYARQHTVLLVRTGSQLFGTSVSTTPDDDEVGIFVEGQDSMFSADSLYKRPDQVSYRTARGPDGMDARSSANDVDGQLISLNHFMRETAKGNPNTITLLFAPKDKILAKDCWEVVGSLLTPQHRDRFISKAMGTRYLRYVLNQRTMYLDNPKVKRSELVAQYGFDTKGAYHALRVALQGYELMSTGHISLPMTTTCRTYLLGVRRGMYSKAEVFEHLRELENNLARAIVESDWPDEPDYSLLTRWNSDLHEVYWDYQQECGKRLF